VLNTDSGRTLRCIRALSSEINQLLCCSLSSAHASKTFLVSTTNQIKIYEYDKFTRKSEFSFRNEMRIKFVKWMPCDDKVLAILRNDTICVFSDGISLKPIRRYDPLKAREKFLRKSSQRIEMMKYVADDSENHKNGNSSVANDNSGEISTN
jgi:WD40 repeat protein